MEDLFSENFKSNQEELIGVEIEYHLLDEETLDLADKVEPLMKQLGEDDCIGPEVFQSCIEIRTDPVKTSREIGQQIREKLNKLRPALSDLNLRLCSLGVHPFSTRISQTTNKPRYLELEKEHPYVTHHLFNFSIHVHVSMESFAQTIDVMNKLRVLLPVFIAVSASCPYWQGEETGFASFRQSQLKQNFNGGPPPHFESEADYYSYLMAAHKTGAIKSLKDIHWDIKPRPEIGTLELRIMDAVPDLHEAVALIAFAHCTIRALKKSSLEELLPEFFLELPPPWAEITNYSQAIHDGIDAGFIANQQGETFPLKEIVERLIKVLDKTAFDINETEGLERVKTMLNSGLPYQRITEIYEKTHSFKEIVRYAADKIYV